MGINSKCLLVSLIALAIPAEVHATDQASSQDEARVTHDDGSDRSLKKSYTNGLNAVDNFYNLNIPGAIHYGLKAYGNYRNHEKMDDLRDKNAKLESSMASAGSQAFFVTQAQADPNGASSVTSTAPTAPEKKSPMDRLDKGFLRDDPEASAVAARLERLSGMSRENMFNLTARVHAKYLDWSPFEPDSVKKAQDMYRELANGLPAGEFKSIIQSREDMIFAAPKLVQEILSRLREVVASENAAGGTRTPASEPAKTEPAPAAAAVAPAPVVAAVLPPSVPQGENGTSDGRFSERGTVTPTRDPNLVGLDRIGQEPTDPFLSELARNSQAEDDHLSLFQVMSSKIREMNFRQDLERRHERPTAATAVPAPAP